jgi:hypothetical protein
MLGLSFTVVAVAVAVAVDEESEEQQAFLSSSFLFAWIIMGP